MSGTQKLILPMSNTRSVIFAYTWKIPTLAKFDTERQLPFRTSDQNALTVQA